MKRPLIIIAILLAAVLAVLLTIRQFREDSQRDSGEAPLHYFIPDLIDNPEVIRCDFTNTLDRSDMSTLWQEPLEPCNLGTGWTNPAPSGVVSMARSSTFDISLPTTDWSVLLMTVKAFKNPDADQPQTMSVEINGQPIGTVEVPREWTTIQLPLPEGVLREGSNRFSATFGYRIRPIDRKDYRFFSMHLRNVIVAHAPQGTLTTRHINHIVKNQLTEELSGSFKFVSRSRVFVISRPGTLVFPMTLPSDAERLEIDVEGHGEPDGGPNVVLGIRNMKSAAAGGLDPPSTVKNLGRDTSRLGMNVTALAGNTCFLTLEIAQLSPHKKVRISPPRITRRSAPQAGDTLAEDRPSVTASHPDIILITLDAARARNLSCYDYHRETTPNIDRLADEALVFRNTFALAPYTLCSVPTMITGLSPLDHQITRHGQRLTEDATTLAEYLKTVGYRTACFSATPNNSRAIGADQGYEKFVETWKVVPRPGSAEPFLLSRMATEWLSTIDESEPLHLQLHYVPPHAPYSPAPEFDVFTDPAYSGRYDGSHETINALDADLRDFEPEDLAQVVARYDGNLRAGDAAVAEVLDALRRRPRWRNTVVLVTSDHGEAFLEHGRMSHNSTVYDEMLHVPFILRLPDDFDGSGADTDRLASLADIVPTLLATAGIETVQGLEGINLLAPGAAGAPSRGRHIVSRTANDRPLFALRTLSHKLILSGSGQGVLFDIGVDPGETDDLSLRNPTVFSGLGRFLTHRLSRAPLFDAATEALPTEDAEMLKALGYVQ